MLLELEIYHTYVRQALRLIALRACAMVAESALSETFFPGKKIWQRKSDPGEYRSWNLVHERPMHSSLSHWGSGSSEVFLYCLVLVTEYIETA